MRVTSFKRVAMLKLYGAGGGTKLLDLMKSPKTCVIVGVARVSPGILRISIEPSLLTWTRAQNYAVFTTNIRRA